MTVQCLIKARTLGDQGMKKGMVSAIRDVPFTWGSKECLPNFIILEITDVTKAQVVHYLESWYNVFEYEVTDIPASNPPTKEIVLSVNRNIITVTGKELKQAMRLFLLTDWGVDLVTYDSSSVTFRMPSDTDFVKMKSELKDRFEEMVSPCIHQFSEVDVDTVIDAGGFLSITKAQAMAKIVDRRL